MPESDRTTLRPGLVATVLALAAPALVGCLPGGGVRETGAIVRPAPPLVPSATEAGYIGETARAVFRRRQSEQGDRFVLADPIAGYGACVRSEAAGGGYDYALIVLQRRVFEEAISQVADDAIILRGPDDTAICRDPSARFDWVRTA